MPAQKSIIFGADFSSTIALDQGSATFPQSRAKNKLCKVWRAVLIFHQQFGSLCSLWCC